MKIDWNKIQIILLFLQSAVITFLVVILYTLEPTSMEQNYQTQIIYDETVNETQKICIDNMIKDLDENMKSGIKSITFMDNIEGYPFMKGLLGKNIKGNIYIVIPEDVSSLQMRITICHEILHSWIERDGEEELIRYLSKAYVPCFPTLFRSYVLDDCSLELIEDFAKAEQTEQGEG